MEKPFKDLQEFHRVFGLLNPEHLELPSEDARKLRISLLKEEFEEYLEAEEDDDIIEIADALADIVYIAYGTAVAYGIPLDKVFNEVHRSNMAKVGADGTIRRREDGKVLKPDSWTPPDIESILEQAKRK